GVVPEHADVPAVGVAEAGQALDRRGLPRAVRPQEAEDLALLDRERHVGDRDRVAVPLSQSRDLDDRHVVLPRRTPIAPRRMARGPRAHIGRAATPPAPGRADRGSTDRWTPRGPAGDPGYASTVAWDADERGA